MIARALALAGAALFAAGCTDLTKKTQWEKGTLVSSASDIDALAVDDSGIYFTTAGHLAADNVVRRAPLAGGPSTLLARGGKLLLDGGIALDATHVYVTARADGTILRVPKTGGSLEPLTSAAGGASELLVDDQAIYFLVFSKTGAGIVGKLPRTGGPVVELAGGLRGADGLTQSPTRLYWRASRGLLSVAKAGGPVQLEVGPTPHGPPQKVAIDATHLYFIADPAAGKLYRRPLAGGPVVELAPRANGLHAPRIQGGQVYYVDREYSDGALRRVPVAGGPPTLLGTGHVKAGISAHPSGVYVHTGHQIFRLGL